MLMKLHYTLLLICLCGIILSCSRRLPGKVYEAFQLDWEIIDAGDSLYFQAFNPLACPVAFTVFTTDTSIRAAFGDQIPRLLKPRERIRLNLAADWSTDELKQAITPYAIQSRLKPVVPDTSHLYRFPFPKGHVYPIIQAYGGQFSHRQSAFSYYAVDFGIPIGDTVCAARDGIVVGLVEDNKNWMHGPDRKYREYANYLRLYHADETYTDYVHLKHKGTLVALGDTVQAGQPIGIAGYTGFTSTPHLHFNTIMPTDTGTLVSFPVLFETIDGRDLQEGMQVGHD